MKKPPTVPEATKKLQEAKLEHCAQLLAFFERDGLKEIGSASISSVFAKDLETIRDMMENAFFITVQNKGMHDVFQNIGTGSDGYFYFGGKQRVPNELEREVSAVEYMQYFSLLARSLNKRLRTTIEIVAKEFAAVYAVAPIKTTSVKTSH